MYGQFSIWFDRKFPRNYIFRHPMSGAILILGFSLVFVLLYKPLGSHPGRYLGFEANMLAYSLISSSSAYALIRLLKRTLYFSDTAEWTMGKELTAILVTLTCMGLFIYLAGFIIEVPSGRLNFATLLDSVKNSFLVGIIPFGIFVLINYRFCFEENEFAVADQPEEVADAPEQQVKIVSQLKKECLDFFPSRLIMVESEGNYVNFYLLQENKVQKRVIRNTINNIEAQLSGFPYIFRTHRAFIVNLGRILHIRGNSLGYRLRMVGIDKDIPVSRTKSKNFRQLLKQIS